MLIREMIPVYSKKLQNYTSRSGKWYVQLPFCFSDLNCTSLSIIKLHLISQECLTVKSRTLAFKTRVLSQRCLRHLGCVRARMAVTTTSWLPGTDPQDTETTELGSYAVAKVTKTRRNRTANCRKHTLRLKSTWAPVSCNTISRCICASLRHHFISHLTQTLPGKSLSKKRKGKASFSTQEIMYNLYSLTWPLPTDCAVDLVKSNDCHTLLYEMALATKHIHPATQQQPSSHYYLPHFPSFLLMRDTADRYRKTACMSVYTKCGR